MAESPKKLKPIVLYDHLPGILAGYPAILFLLMALFSYFKWFDTHMMFWIGLSIMILWYVAFRFNLPKSKFIMLVGLLGTFVGIPVVLEKLLRLPIRVGEDRIAASVMAQYHRLQFVQLFGS